MNMEFQELLDMSPEKSDEWIRKATKPELVLALVSELMESYQQEKVGDVLDLVRDLHTGEDQPFFRMGVRELRRELTNLLGEIREVM